jgi:transcriptional regulator with XRE-family HTH domain
MSDHFARKLQQLMAARSLSASDVARGIYGTTTDARGYTVAKGRDRISTYLAGKQSPSRETLTRIATFLGVPPGELAPDVAGSRSAHDDPELAMRTVGGGLVHLRVNQTLPLSIAAKIMELLAEVAPATGGL